LHEKLLSEDLELFSVEILQRWLGVMEGGIFQFVNECNYSICRTSQITLDAVDYNIEETLSIQVLANLWSWSRIA
jgi:hypothetical protein